MQHRITLNVVCVSAELICCLIMLVCCISQLTALMQIIRHSRTWVINGVDLRTISNAIRIVVRKSVSLHCYGLFCFDYPTHISQDWLNILEVTLSTILARVRDHAYLSQNIFDVLRVYCIWRTFFDAIVSCYQRTPQVIGFGGYVHLFCCWWHCLSILLFMLTAIS